MANLNQHSISYFNNICHFGEISNTEVVAITIDHFMALHLAMKAIPYFLSLPAQRLSRCHPVDQHFRQS